MTESSPSQAEETSAAEPDSRIRPSRRQLLTGAAALAGVGSIAVLAGSGGSETEGQGATMTPTDQTDARPADVTATGSAASPVENGPVIGANLNGRPRRLADDMSLLEASNTRWIRAFLDVRQKASVDDPAGDPDVVALRLAAREHDCALVVSLKWDFKGNWGTKEPISVPGAGSSAEAQFFEQATAYLDSIGVPLDVVVLGNEPMWETREADITVENPPIVGFTRRLAAHLATAGDHGDPAYLVGSVNRLQGAAVRRGRFAPFYRGLVDLIDEDNSVDGLDLHVHFDKQREARAMLEYARETVPDGILTVTEFSPVWRYNRNKDRPIGNWDTGTRFASDYGYSPTMTAVEYFEDAKRRPRTPEELAAFYAAMPWYNVDHVSDMHALFAEYDVSLGTIGFLQDVGMRNVDWTTGWTPFHINALFQPALTAAATVAETANLHYIDDYRRLSGR